MNFRHAAEIYAGVSEYNQTHHLEWRLIPLNFAFETTLIALAKTRQIEAVIGTFVSDNWIHHLTSLNIQAINLFHFSKIHSVPSVCVNDLQIGKIAATHLISQGAANFAFYGPDSVYFTQLREQGFTQSLPTSNQYTRLPSRQSLQQQLLEITRPRQPVGIFCSNDHQARELILTAQELELDVGSDLLVVGVDNDPSESIFANIGISSIAVPSKAIGLQAAALLDHSTPENKVHFAGHPRLIARASSLASKSARTFERAKNHINEHLSDPYLDIESLATACAVSRRVLELSFQDQSKQSPYQYIATRRLQKAQTLLQQTNLPIAEIGHRCGYPEPHHFSAWFKQRTQLSPKRFRQQSKIDNSHD